MDMGTAIRQIVAQLQAPPTPPPTTAPSSQSNLVDTNIIYSPKFGALDFTNDPWQYSNRSGSGTERGQTFAITFNFGGKNYSFIPEDRIQKGWVDSGRYTYSPAFLKENTIKSLATNGEYIDLSKAPMEGLQLADGSTIKTYGDYLTKTAVGASPKGFLVPTEQLGNYFPNTSYLDPKFGAITGLAQDPTTGELGYAATGGGNIQAPIAKLGSVGYYEKPSGALADLGRAILDMGPIATLALNFAVPGLGTGIGVGRAIGLGDIEGAAKALVIGEIIGQSGIAENVAGATGSTALGTAAAGTAGGLLSGQNLQQAATTGAVQGAVSGAAGTVAEKQASDYIQNLPIPDYLDAGPAPTSADTIAIYPDTNPNLVNTTLSDITTLPTGTTEGINATLPTTLVTNAPVDYSLAPATKAVTVDDVVKNIVLENLDTSLQTGTLTADQVDTALNTLTGGYTLGGTTEGIKATLPDTIVSGTEPVDYTLNVLTGGEGLKLPTSSNLDTMGGGQGLTANVDGGVLSEEGITRTGDVILGDPNSFINTTLPLSTDTIDTSTKTDETSTDTPLTKEQIEAMIKLAVTLALADQAKKVITDATTSGNNDTTVTGNPYIPSDISGWASPTYTQTFQGPIDLNSLFTTDNLLGGTQWAGLQGNQFANIPQVSMSNFISSIQNGKV
jgi:hypothetical protein